MARPSGSPTSRDFFNKAGSAGPGLSGKVIGEGLPHILQEMRDDTAGVTMRSLERGTIDVRMEQD